MIRLARLFVLVLVFSAFALGQNGIPIPDFGSRTPDLTDQVNIRFQQYEKAPLKFSTTTTYILVPVVVTDKDGNPVQGLKKDQFRLQENGKEQAIASIEEFKPSSAPVVVARSAARNEVTNQVDGAPSPRRLVIVVFDMLNTAFEDQPRARRALVRYLADSADPNALYLLAALDNKGLKILHDFTSNTAPLLAALQQARSGLSTANSPGVGPTYPAIKSVPVSADTGAPDSELAQLKAFSDAIAPYEARQRAQNAEDTLRSFMYLADRVSGIPGRKSMVWITGGFPISIDPNSGAVAEGYGFGAYQHVMQKLSDQLISVYPVDARGLLALGDDASVHMAKREDTRAANSLQSAADFQRDVLETMRAFADLTGGRAFVNNNDTKGAIKEASRDGASYYMLSYPMDKSDKRQGFRKISVKVGDYKIRARKGYYATQIALDAQMTAKNDIDTALMSPLDYTGLPLRVVVDKPVTAGDKRKVAFTMLMPPNSAKIDASDGNHLFVEIAYSLKSSAGKDSGHKGLSYNLKLQPQQLEAINTQGVSYGDAIEVAPGSYTLRVVVRDNLTGKVGSVLAVVEAN